MKMQIEVKGWLYATYYPWHKNGNEPHSFGFERGVLNEQPFNNENTIYLRPWTIETEIEVSDPTAKIVEALREQKKEVFTKAAQEAAEIDDKIEKYLAITNEVPATVEDKDDFPF